MAWNYTMQVSVEAGSTWAQRSGISFLKGLRAIERAWICHYAFRSTEPSKRGEFGHQLPGAPSRQVVVSFTFTSIESNCTCDWDCPEVKFLPQWLHQNTDFTPNGQDLINIDFFLWHVTLAPFTLNQSQLQQSFQQGSLLIMSLFVPENIFVGFLIKVCIIRVYTHCFLNVIFPINSKAKVSA